MRRLGSIVGVAGTLVSFRRRRQGLDFVCASYVAMAVASQARSGGALWSKNCAAGMEAGGALKEGAAVAVQAGGIGNGNGKSGFSFRKLFRTLSCFQEPITAEGDDALPKFVTIGGEDGEDLDSPRSGDLKARLRDDAVDERDDYDARDDVVDEIFLSAREDVEGLCPTPRVVGVRCLLHALCGNNCLKLPLISEPSCMRRGFLLWTQAVCLCEDRVRIWRQFLQFANIAHASQRSMRPLIRGIGNYSSNCARMPGDDLLPSSCPIPSSDLFCFQMILLYD